MWQEWWILIAKLTKDKGKKSLQEWWRLFVRGVGVGGVGGGGVRIIAGVMEIICKGGGGGWGGVGWGVGG